VNGSVALKTRNDLTSMYLGCIFMSKEAIVENDIVAWYSYSICTNMTVYQRLNGKVSWQCIWN